MKDFNAVQRLVLTQEAPLSPILFLIYINDIVNFCHRSTTETVLVESIGESEITMTADDILRQSKEWPSLQLWLDACSRCAKKKKMRWDRTERVILNCVICITQGKIERSNFRFHMSGGDIKKVSEATYF